MNVAYVDTSCLVAIAFGETGGRAIARRLDACDELVAANLVEAELRAAFAREGVEPRDAVVAGLSWIVPDRPLHAEITRVLSAGYVRGADCWHLAAALYVAAEPPDIVFLTLDARQRQVAASLGFAT